ncbi:hypothetical protein Nepgr_028211 [Nepenthes gracilis]|uniref:Uncharacterized protein n=1 Tax=Nepenthes gracilis TaxID=150966 RepID=A0AAD3Y274_NEPGR|nr:hypothetical protein Nepgr_028211 [Nepenthes gracilis]
MSVLVYASVIAASLFALLLVSIFTVLCVLWRLSQEYIADQRAGRKASRSVRIVHLLCGANKSRIVTPKSSEIEAPEELPDIIDDDF